MIGNQNRTEEVEAGGKGEHSYYKWKGSSFRGAEETVMWQRRGSIACRGVPKG